MRQEPEERRLGRRALVRGAAAASIALPFGLAACEREPAVGASKSAASPGASDAVAAPPPPKASEPARETFPELSDQRGALEPIRAEERAARRRRLGSVLAKVKADAYVCESGSMLRYLAGVDWGLSERLFALVVLADGSHFFLSPAFEVEKARQRIDATDGPGGEVVAWEEHEYAFKPLAAALKKRKVERVCLDPQLRLFAAENLGREVEPKNLLSGAEVRAQVRGVKDAHELALIRKACELTQRALSAVAERLRPGMTGGEVSSLIQAAQRKLGLVKTWDLSLPGPAASIPHGGTATQKIEPGQFLLIDCGGEYLEYQSDITRTWCVAGPPDPEVARVWGVVRDAQRRAFDVVASGKECGDVDRAARETIERGGFGSGYEYFTHRLGHGIGMEGQEDPYFDSGSKVVLAPGMTLSNEPGLYFRGKYGVRLEDILAVTEQGCEIFGTPQSAPDRPI